MNKKVCDSQIECAQSLSAVTLGMEWDVTRSEERGVEEGKWGVASRRFFRAVRIKNPLHTWCKCST